MSEPIEPTPAILAEAFQALRDLGVSDRAGAEMALSTWRRRDQLDAEEIEHILTFYSLSHPAWCSKPADEWETEEHTSKPIPCHRPDDLLGIWICARQAHPPMSDYTGINLVIMESGESDLWPLPTGQARLIERALRVALRIAEAAS